MKQFSEYSLGRRAVLVLSSGLLTGYVPKWSGTFGTLPAIVLLYPFRHLNEPTWPSGVIFLAIVLAIVGAAIAVSEVAERTYGVKDSGKIVADEIAGFFVSMLFVPFRWPHIAAAFIIFRVMDVLKPPPIRRLQFLHGGWGVVIDDFLAGLITCLVVHAMMGLGILR